MTISLPNCSATADTFVHYLFATPGNEPILRSFVNAVQENAGQPRVKETHVLNPFNPKTFLADKSSIIDIKARTENNHSFIIEFQVARHEFFENRMLYYWAKAYCQQIQHSNSYEKLAPVIMMIVTRFLMFPELEKLHNTFWITTQDAPEIPLTNNLQIHTMELAGEKTGQIPVIGKPLREWLEFFHYSDQKSEAEMRTLLNDSSPEVKDAYGEYLRFNQNEELRRLEDARERYLLGYNTDVSVAERRGKAEGKTEAILTVLKARFGRVPQTIRNAVTHTTKPAVLNRLTTLAAKCKTLAEFSESMK